MPLQFQWMCQLYSEETWTKTFFSLSSTYNFRKRGLMEWMRNFSFIQHSELFFVWSSWVKNHWCSLSKVVVSIIKVWNKKKILCDICCDFLVSYLIIVHLIFFLNQKINRFDNTKKEWKESVFSTPSFSWRKTREKRLRKKKCCVFACNFW